MARTPRNEVSRARRGVSVRGERRIVRLPVDGPVAASIARVQHNGTHFGAPSDIMGSSLVPSSGVEVQPGYLVDALGEHRSICMGLQPRRPDLDVLTLAELDTTQRQEGTGATNLQTVFPLEFGNQSSKSIRASPFQSYRALASGLSGNPTSNALNAAPAAPTALNYDFPVALCLGPEVISPVPEILPLSKSEELHMFDQLFPPQLNQNLEDPCSLSPPKKLYQPNHLEGPMQMVNYDPPSHSFPRRSLLPLGEMNHHSATHPQSFPFGHWHQQSPQQPLTDLDGDGDMQRQLLGSAPFHSSPSNEPCAMEYPAGYPPSPNSNVITAIVPNTVEATPTVNITPFNSLAQSPATGALPNSALVPNGSAHPASENHSNDTARRVTAGRGRMPRNRLPQRRQATGEKLRQIRTAPTPPSTMNLAEVMLVRMESQRQNHMKSERKKRQQMNELFANIRGLLSPAARKKRPDNATVLFDMTNLIKRTVDELTMLEQQIQQSRELVEALRNEDRCVHHMDTVTTLPPVESYSGFASFLGENVAIKYCDETYSLRVSSPYLGQAFALLEPMVIAIQDHHLEVLFVSIITTGNTQIYTLRVKATSDAELLRDNLHSVLQGIVNNFPSSSSNQEHRG